MNNNLLLPSKVHNILQNLHFQSQGVYSDMYMTGGLGPGIFLGYPKNKYQEKSDRKKIY